FGKLISQLVRTDREENDHVEFAIARIVLANQMDAYREGTKRDGKRWRRIDEKYAHRILDAEFADQRRFTVCRHERNLALWAISVSRETKVNENGNITAGRHFRKSKALAWL